MFLKCLIIISTDEANRSQLWPYIYYPKKDLLLRASKPIEYGGENGLPGCCLLYLLMMRLDEVTTMLSDKQITFQCRWAGIRKGVCSPEIQVEKRSKSTNKHQRVGQFSPEVLDHLNANRGKFMNEL